jgi:hypothetical protein
LINKEQKKKLDEIIRNIQYACGEMQLIKNDISYDLFTQANKNEGFDKEIIATFNTHINHLSNAVDYMDSF